jgi:hypothetical protein
VPVQAGCWKTTYRIGHSISWKIWSHLATKKYTGLTSFVSRLCPVRKFHHPFSKLTHLPGIQDFFPNFVRLKYWWKFSPKDSKFSQMDISICTICNDHYAMTTGSIGHGHILNPWMQIPHDPMDANPTWPIRVPKPLCGICILLCQNNTSWFYSLQSPQNLVRRFLLKKFKLQSQFEQVTSLSIPFYCNQ